MLKTRHIHRWGLVGLCFLLLGSGVGRAQDQQPSDQASDPTPSFAISDQIDDRVRRQAAEVAGEFSRQAQTLFERKPLDWDWETVTFIYQWFLNLPAKIPALLNHLIEQSRLWGFVGTLLVLTFLAAVLYSFLGQRRVMARIETTLSPLRRKIPEHAYPIFIAGIQVVAAALVPLFLLLVYLSIRALIVHHPPWFQLLGRLLILWSLGALIINLLQALLTKDLFSVTVQYGRRIFSLARLAVLYLFLGIAVAWGASVYPIRSDVIAFIQFVIAVTFNVVLFVLFLHRHAILSLLPELPYKSYASFKRLLRKYYYPFLVFSFLMAFLWCFGYRDLGRLVLVKTWTTLVAYVVIMASYHLLNGWLERWSQRIKSGDEAAQLMVRSLKSALRYVTVLATVIIVLNLLGLLGPMQRLMSFPVFSVQDNPVTLWVIVRALIILLAFVYASRILQAYLDYRVYPALGIDTGLAYALNTVLKYSLFIVGFLVALNIVGLNLKFLLVFAGAIGIGIGLGLQNIAANVISGFTIIFGGKIRKGDWIEMGGTLGTVTDIYLRATKVRTRDNIEYLVPNTELIDNTIINYSLSSPMIRIELPLGVSYSSDPDEVSRIVLEVAENEPLVSTFKKPEMRFTGYGDSSIDFELLFWIDVRTTARRRVRSLLYFKIFEEFGKAGIEIPFPQRDVYIKSQPA